MAKKGKKPTSKYDDRGDDRSPRSSFAKGNEKRPRGTAPDYGGELPLWAFRIVDLDGPWCWSKMDGGVLRDVLDRLKQLETMSWHEIESKTGSHFIETGDTGFCKQARDRLAEIRQDDADALFSLRVTGRRRIWGIRDGGILRILWWDPEHEVYPSHLKGT
jgi:hypothetical protein